MRELYNLGRGGQGGRSLLPRVGESAVCFFLPAITARRGVDVESKLRWVICVFCVLFSLVIVLAVAFCFCFCNGDCVIHGWGMGWGAGGALNAKIVILFFSCSRLRWV